MRTFDRCRDGRKRININKLTGEIQCYIYRFGFSEFYAGEPVSNHVLHSHSLATSFHLGFKFVNNDPFSMVAIPLDSIATWLSIGTRFNLIAIICPKVFVPTQTMHVLEGIIATHLSSINTCRPTLNTGGSVLLKSAKRLIFFGSSVSSSIDICTLSTAPVWIVVHFLWYQPRL